MPLTSAVSGTRPKILAILQRERPMTIDKLAREAGPSSTDLASKDGRGLLSFLIARMAAQVS